MKTQLQQGVQTASARCAETALFGIDFLEQSVGMSPLVHHIEYEAYVDADAACKTMVEIDVGGKTVPVAVEGKTYEVAVAVEHRRTRVTACYVVVGKEA